MTTAFGAKTPQYTTVLELDRKVRDFPVPWRLRIKCGLAVESEPTKVVHIQRWFVMSCKESSESRSSIACLPSSIAAAPSNELPDVDLCVHTALLNLHRPYFAQALNELPHDLLRHRYGPSVMAIYRSAWRLIEGLRETHKKAPQVVERLGLPWSQSLSAAVCFHSLHVLNDTDAYMRRLSCVFWSREHRLPRWHPRRCTSWTVSANSLSK